jgi:large subunit ribosomal protein L33
MRDNIVLQCGDCKNRNYVTTKNKKKTTTRLEFKKFCRFCRKHTAHNETKRSEGSRIEDRLPPSSILGLQSSLLE